MTESRPARPRVRRGIRRAAIVAGILLLPIAAHALWDFVEMRRLVREIEAIREKGEPVTGQEAGYTYSGATPDHRRSSQCYVAAAALALQSDQFVPEIATVHEWLSGATSLTKSREETAAQLKRTLDQEQDALRLMDTANNLEFRGFFPGTEYSYRTAGLWRLSRLVSARTLYFSLMQEPEQASQSAQSSLTLRRTLRRPFGFGPVNSEIPALLSLTSPGQQTLERLQSALEVAEAAHRPEENIAAQRAWVIESWWQRYYGIDPRAPRNYSLPMRSFGEWLFRPLLTHDLVETLKHWAELAEAARHPWPEKIAATADVAKRYPPRKAAGSRLPYGRDLLRNYVGLQPNGVEMSSLVHDRASRIAVAIERYRRDHDGTRPATLHELVPQYLRAVPVDPASGKDMLYHKETGAYVVYSVGYDGKDDGGDINSELVEVIKRGWGRRNIAGRDVGIRVVMH